MQLVINRALARATLVQVAAAEVEALSCKFIHQVPKLCIHQTLLTLLEGLQSAHKDGA